MVQARRWTRNQSMADLFTHQWTAFVVCRYDRSLRSLAISHQLGPCAMDEGDSQVSTARTPPSACDRNRDLFRHTGKAAIRTTFAAAWRTSDFSHSVTQLSFPNSQAGILAL